MGQHNAIPNGLSLVGWGKLCKLCLTGNVWNLQTRQVQEWSSGMTDLTAMLLEDTDGFSIVECTGKVHSSPAHHSPLQRYNTTLSNYNTSLISPLTEN